MLKDYGYKMASVQVRELTIAELKLEIIRMYLQKGNKEVKLIDLTSGDTATFNSTEDVLLNRWSGNCKIELVNLPHSFGTMEEYKTVIVFQSIEDGRVIA